MPETFLHGVEVIEIDDGPRPIQTVRSSVIGVVGTAPDSQQEVKSTLQIGSIGTNNALTFTSKLAGSLGNAIGVRRVDPKANNATLSISVSNTEITVNLATGPSGAITTTATQLSAAIAANPAAHALVGVANTGASTGAGVVGASRIEYMTGGLDEAFPLNTPVLVPGDTALAAKLGASGTLPKAMDGIFDQTGAVVIVVRVAEGEDETATLANVVGGVDVGTGQYKGAWALLGAESKVGFCPRILCAPGWTHQRTTTANPVVAEMLGIANRLRAVIIADGPNTTDAAAITYRGDWGSKRVYVVDPWVMVTNSVGEVVAEPASARVAGMIARSDNERGFWWSPSNQIMNGIVGTARVIDFVRCDKSSRAHLLNEQEVATIIRDDGFRLWGNRTCTEDPKWAFLSVVRTADMINDSVLRAHKWAVDRNITRTYLSDVAEGVNDYMKTLVAMGAILGGECYPAPGLNTPANISQGKVFMEFRFTPPYPAEHITFRSKLVQDYIEEIL